MLAGFLDIPRSFPELRALSDADRRLWVRKFKRLNADRVRRALTWANTAGITIVLFTFLPAWYLFAEAQAGESLSTGGPDADLARWYAIVLQGAAFAAGGGLFALFTTRFLYCFALRRMIRRFLEGPKCPCGYPLAGIPADDGATRCPECGATFRPDNPAA